MKKIVGLPGARGQAVLKAVVFRRCQFVVEKRASANVAAEIDAFNAVRQEYAIHLQQLYERTIISIDEESAKIFKAYELIAKDDFFFKKPFKTALEQEINVDYAVDVEKRRVMDKFAAMQDPYMRERAVDIGNVCDELIRRMNGIVDEGPAQYTEPFLIVAEDLSPEDTVRIDKAFLGGFITEKGGVTSHTVILAKTLGIPAVVGAAGIMSEVESGQWVYLNGDDGYGIVSPDMVFMEGFKKEKTKLDADKKKYEAVAGQNAVTVDGHKVHVCINSGDAESVRRFNALECDGVGLFRTEFLFMGQRDYPCEELQYNAYKEIVEKAGGKEVIIRTLDIGGDKKLDYMDIAQEENPFLGYRAIRICLDRPEMFFTQLRAILRASAFGKAKIMFPMIVTCEELEQAKVLLEKAKVALRQEMVAFDEDIQVGIMIETPASVFISEQLARRVDFFSIGTNDLIQYITATDRMNEKVQYLYDPCNISVLRAIAVVIESAHAAGITVGMCGEMASDERMVPLLLGMGLDEFSVVPLQVGRLKYMIRHLVYEDMQRLAEKVIKCDSVEKVKEYLAEIEIV